MDENDHAHLAADPLSQPTGIRYFLWIGIGKALGLPVDDLLEAITINLEAAKRERGKRPAPFTVHERLRLAELAVTVGRGLQSCFTWLAAPASLVRWSKRYQERQAQKTIAPDQPRVGRPRASPEKVAAVLKIYHSGAKGLKRIEGELRKCGITLARSTIRRILDDHGLPPGENWTPGNNWRTFWRNHAPATIGIDFIQIAVGLFGKVSYHFALIGIEHDSRRVHLLGLTEHPNDCWLRNVVRSTTMDGEPLAERKYWIHDNDGKFQTLANLLKNRGKKSANTAVRAPDMNAFAERFIRSAREECLDHIVFLTEGHLRSTLRSYIEHYNIERPHQGIGNVTIGPWQTQDHGEIVCDTRLNGLLVSFRRAA